jgi:signal transduction histidine kinase
VVRGEERPIIGDATRLHQVITNLLSNAIKFTPAGGRVDLALTFEHSAAALTVRDTGAGIDPSFLPHVFERFRQGHATPSRQRSGLGLGLAIVKHLVEAHGGQVSVESEGLGQGSTFRVRLPIVASGEADPQRDIALPSAVQP